jgi:hypothetical protein
MKCSFSSPQVMIFALFFGSVASSACAELTNEERQSMSDLRSMHKELSENNLSGDKADAQINRFKKNLPRKVAASPNIQIAIAVVQIDCGVNPKRDAIAIASRLKTNWTAWKVALVAELVFGDASGAVSILSRFQKAAVTLASSAQIDDPTRKEAIQQLLWIKDAANQLAILPATSDAAVNKIIDSGEAENLIRVNVEGKDLIEADENRRQADEKFKEELQNAVGNKTAFVTEQLASIETELPQQITMLSSDFKNKFTELQPLAASLSAARATSNAADSAVSSIRSRLTTARSKASDIDEDEEPGAKAAAETAVSVLEGQLASARATADAARAEESEAEVVYLLKLVEMQEIYANAANIVNYGKNQVLHLSKEFGDIIEGSLELQEQFSNVEKMIALLLKDFPPMPTFVRRKSSKEMALEETRRIVKKLQLSVDDVFNEIAR